MLKLQNVKQHRYMCFNHVKRVWWIWGWPGWSMGLPHFRVLDLSQPSGGSSNHSDTRPQGTKVPNRRRDWGSAGREWEKQGKKQGRLCLDLPSDLPGSCRHSRQHRCKRRREGLKFHPRMQKVHPYVRVCPWEESFKISISFTEHALFTQTKI
jgi:hypothetical protein